MTFLIDNCLHFSFCRHSKVCDQLEFWVGGGACDSWLTTLIQQTGSIIQTSKTVCSIKQILQRVLVFNPRGELSFQSKLINSHYTALAKTLKLIPPELVTTASDPITPSIKAPPTQKLAQFVRVLSHPSTKRQSG